MSLRSAVVTGLGHCLPERIVTNDDLAARLDTSDEWIRTRTGIRQRHIVDTGTSTSDLAVGAGRRALAAAGLTSVGVVIVATTTPDHPCPATAPVVATRLGLVEAPAFDVNAVCSGFLYALATADSMLTSGLYDTALVIGADIFSSFIDPDDRSTAFLFGDGAGAMVLRAGEPGEAGSVLAVELGSDGEMENLILVEDAKSPYTMQGQTVYRHAVARMASSTRSILERVGWSVADVDHFVGHQANQRILDAVAGRLKMDPACVVSNLATVGNTAAASIPIALSEASDEGRLRTGDRVVLAAFGGGATWGAAALTWP
ncbi:MULTISPECIES: beta-ketoacyl-ACP synthase III [unclassified Pseudonocardia]|jgi:3-oxoacyl-[acyl-carrier-protein] synthase-3|uniref:beta-ketoacyl-ACP synthase III n=1 Tax=unclassified Pseudonocardia TaxID=2619320 RepID=UPI0009624493|nr:MULTISPECIES: beta-ketoacyl-ACP synthase III [unclassified Pseudonocardia]MBN9098585.1 ketoacyl-ACP synthase III [Pseudonocardia sp.]OJY45473.1 MAG: 3-oxoacyl-ACP synthase [Pseudonocardia sp. 73-21]